MPGVRILAPITGDGLFGTHGAPGHPMGGLGPDDERIGHVFLARVAEETGVRLQVLSGAEEARLTFLAVRRWFGWSAGKLLVLDIGGGSLEIAFGIDEEPDAGASLPLGAGRARPH